MYISKLFIFTQLRHVLFLIKSFLSGGMEVSLKSGEKSLTLISGTGSSVRSMYFEKGSPKAVPKYSFNMRWNCVLFVGMSSDYKKHINLFQWKN